jgi:hypothetical protein
MQPDFHAEVAKETARQVRDLQAVTSAQAMPALCFLLGAMRRGVRSGDSETTRRWTRPATLVDRF